MSIVIYTNPKNGCKYAYESTYEWSPEHKQSRPKRKYLGRVDDEGNIIYSTHKRGGARVKRPKTMESEAPCDENGASSDDGEGRFQKLYEEAEKDRQECMKRIRSLEAEVLELKQSLQHLEGVLSSVHSMTAGF